MEGDCMSEPTIEQMIEELKTAGWKQHRATMTIWISPKGFWFRGPYGAWKSMKTMEGIV